MPFYELFKRGLFVEKEKPLPLVYEEIKMDCGYRLDIVVENKLILEINAFKPFKKFLPFFKS